MQSFKLKSTTKNARTMGANPEINNTYHFTTQILLFNRKC